ncbi:MAG TPA: hypothetical protein PKE35_16690 [Anaerolineales bacterium]|nr:hypothetical protein [Anaerolineales bacterium]HMX75894.1 hypothetical protein [Anaerolineales bacterium]HNB88418.1 hypothetical protein [Anaerolineales bacterium]HNC90538.1 hypothetical protein [Anaerolineales bacterium]HNF36357.1 hypothetical protein [Anaerolineales bacterium]
MKPDKLEQAMELILSGNKRKALPILSRLVQEEPRNESAWVCLYECVDDLPKKTYCLKKILAINPDNQHARAELERISRSNTAIISLEQPPVIVVRGQTQLPIQKTSTIDIIRYQFMKNPIRMWMIVILIMFLILNTGAFIFRWYTLRTVAVDHPLMPPLRTTQSPYPMNLTPEYLYYATQESLPMVQANQIQIIIPETAQPQVSPMQQSLDEYLTAIEQENWEAAYDHTCTAIQQVIHSPKEMRDRVFFEHSTLPVSHEILPPIDRPNRLLFTLTGTTWSSRTFEVSLEINTLKFCGMGVERGDLRYLLFPAGGPLNIAQ